MAGEIGKMDVVATNGALVREGCNCRLLHVAPRRLKDAAKELGLLRLRWKSCV